MFRLSVDKLLPYAPNITATTGELWQHLTSQEQGLRVSWKFLQHRLQSIPNFSRLGELLAEVRPGPLNSCRHGVDGQEIRERDVEHAFHKFMVSQIDGLLFGGSHQADSSRCCLGMIAGALRCSRIICASRFNMACTASIV